MNCFNDQVPKGIRENPGWDCINVKLLQTGGEKTTHLDWIRTDTIP